MPGIAIGISPAFVRFEPQCHAPTFDVVAGAYPFPLIVTLTDNTPGAVIYYTTDGSAPTPTSLSVASGGTVSIEAACTLKAATLAPDESMSPVTSAAYTQAVAAVATFDPPAETYLMPQDITLASTTPDAIIFYTLDGSDPDTESDSVLSGESVEVDETETLKAFARAVGYLDSAITSAAYVEKCQTPTFAPVAGTYTMPQPVVIACSSPADATIYYTLDGSDPTTESESILNGAVLEVDETETVKALAGKAGSADSDVASAAYTQAQCEAPELDPGAGDVVVPQSVTVTCDTAGATIYYTLDGSEPDTESDSVDSGEAIMVIEACTLRAFAAAEGYLDSAPVSAVYTLTLVETPTLLPDAGEYTMPLDVLATSITPGALVHYTLDGSDPDSESDVALAGHVPVESACTVKVIGIAPGYADSAIASAAYTQSVAATPTVDVLAGTYLMPQTVTVTSTTGGDIYYTTDGSAPTLSSAHVASGATVSITGTQTLKTFAHATGYLDSAVTSAAYVDAKLFSVDFTALTAGGIAAGAAAGSAFELATGLRLTRSSAATVRTGTSTVDSTPAADTARIGRKADADPLALVIEHTSINKVKYCRDLSQQPSPWAAGNATIANDAANGPDGSLLADRVTSTSTQIGRYNFVTGLAVGAYYTATQWSRAPAGTTSQQWYCWGLGTLANSADAYTATTAWTRRTITTQVETGYSRLDLASQYGPDQTALGGTTAGARDAYVDLHQMEAGKIATEVIITGATAATRNADRLYHPAAAALVDGGRLSLAVTLAPKGASTDFAFDVPIWTGNESSYVCIDYTTHKLVVSCNLNYLVSTEALSWAKDDVVDIFVACGNGAPIAEYRVNGGAAITLTLSGTDTALAPATIDLLCNGNNAFTSRARSITAYRAGQRPAWAA